MLVTSPTIVRISTAPPVTPVFILEESLPAMVAGLAVSFPYTALAGTGDFTWSSGALPPGLSLNAGTGLLSGTPVGTFDADIAITVTDLGTPSPHQFDTNIMRAVVTTPAIDVAATLEGDSLSSVASVLAQGTLDALLGTLVVTITLPIQGMATIALDNCTLGSTCSVPVQASASFTLGAVTTSGGKEVLTSSHFTEVGGFKLPTSVTASPLADHTASSYRTTDFSYGACAIRRVAGNVHLFTTLHSSGGSMVCEFVVPALSTGAVSAWNTASVYKAWGNIFSGYSYVASRLVTSATSITVTLPESSHWPVNKFADWKIDITSGTGSGQTRTISSSVGNVMTLSSAWTTTPDSTSGYLLYQGEVVAATSTTVTLGLATPPTAYSAIRIVSGTGSGTTVATTPDPLLKTYDAGTGVHTLQHAWPNGTPVAGSKYVTFHHTLWEWHDTAWHGHPRAGQYCYGLGWDEANQRLYGSFGYDYNTVGTLNPSVMFAKLDDATARAVPYGPIKPESQSDKLTRGGSCILSDAFALTAGLGTKKLGLGMGGYYSGFGTGTNSGSYGPALCAADHPPETNNLPLVTTGSSSAFASTARTRLVAYTGPNTQPAAPTPGRRPGNYRSRDPHGNYRLGTVASTGTTTITLGGVPTTVTTITMSGSTGDEAFPLGTDPLPAQCRESSNVSSLLSASGNRDCTLEVTSGVANGAIVDIFSNDHATKKLTLTSLMGTPPGAGSTFRIYGGTCLGGTSTTIIIKASAICTNYTGKYIGLIAGTGSGQDERRVTAQQTINGEIHLTVTPAWATVPVSGNTRYEWYERGFGGDAWDPNGAGDLDGFFQWTDQINGGCFIDTGTKHGFVTVCRLGKGNTYYEAARIRSSGEGGELAEGRICVINPDDLASVASGAIQPYDVVPASMFRPPLTLLAEDKDMKGCAYDPVGGRWYVIHADGNTVGGNTYPVVMVYDITQ